MALHHECFHIRKSADLSLFAAPRGLSQLVTSFFGSWCQGIHLTLLLAWTFSSIFLYLVLFLIAFLHEIRNSQFWFSSYSSLKRLSLPPYVLNCINFTTFSLERPIFFFNCFSLNYLFVFYSVFNDHSRNAFVPWLAQVDSNHRPRAYQARALTNWAMSP